MPLLLPEHLGVPIKDRNLINNPLVLGAFLSVCDGLHYHRLLVDDSVSQNRGFVKADSEYVCFTR